MSEPAAPLSENHLEEIPVWQARDATPEDLPEVSRALAELLSELGGTSPAAQDIEVAARQVLADPERGLVLVVEAAGGGLAGVLAASIQHAIHVAGPYCVLQDLWTDPAWRGRGVGAGLVAELARRMRERGIGRIEVGLPTSAFIGLPATEAFYRENGFETLGPRMRRSVV